MALTLEMLARVLNPLRRRIRLIVSRAILTADADDSHGCQRLDLALLADEERTSVARVQQYGISSRPPSGAEAVCLSAGGVREHMVAVAVDAPASRPTGLKPGEVALWMKQHGVRVLLLDDGHVDLGSQPTDFVALASLVKAELDGIKADLDAAKTSINTHTHPAPGGATSPPAAPLVLSWSPGEVAAEEVRAK